MDRTATIPISSATKSARRGSARLKTKPPVGPLNWTGSPGLRARSHCDPTPPGATSMESVKGPLRVGEDTMLQARTIFSPKGTEIHCPAAKLKSSGSRTRRSTSITVGVIHRTAATSALHSRGLGATASALPQAGDDLARDALELLALVGEVGDGIHQEVAAAGGGEALELLHAFRGRPDDAVAGRQRPEILGIALGQEPDPGRLGGLVIAADGDEGQMSGGKAPHPNPRRSRWAAPASGRALGRWSPPPTGWTPP